MGAETAVPIRSFRRSHGWDHTTWQARLMRRADTDHDGRTTVGELDAYVANPRDARFISRRHYDSITAPTPTAPWARRIARRADADHDHTTTAAELNAYLSHNRHGVIGITDQQLDIVRAEVARLSGAEDTLADLLPCTNGRLLVNEYSEICYSDERRTPIGVAYTLSGTDYREDIPRVDAFREDPDLPPAVRSTLADYARSGFDRGHLRPAEDSPTVEAMSESFEMSNMSPQYGNVNQAVWRILEQDIHELATVHHAEVSIVTGNLYLDAEMRTIGSGVSIPTHLYKMAIFTLPDGSTETRVYVVPNDPTFGRKMPEIRRILAESVQTREWLDEHLR